jgi:protein-tyrosine phosphatase
MQRFAFRNFLAFFFLSAPAFFFSSLSARQSPSTVSLFPHGEKIQISGVKNAGKINDRLFRGAQPASEAFAELKRLGITTVVDLRIRSGEVNRERRQAESRGLHFLNLPVGGFSAPSDQQLAQFLSLFRGNPNEKVFVHCHYGDDRTGVFVASYRIALDNWSAAQAMHEMYFFGFNGKWQPVMKRFVRNFPSRISSSPSFADFKHQKVASPGDPPPPVTSPFPSPSGQPITLDVPHLFPMP